jgi:hypothetical protein
MMFGNFKYGLLWFPVFKFYLNGIWANFWRDKTSNKMKFTQNNGVYIKIPNSGIKIWMLCDFWPLITAHRNWFKSGAENAETSHIQLWISTMKYLLVCLLLVLSASAQRAADQVCLKCWELYNFNLEILIKIQSWRKYKQHGFTDISNF